jgi:hypothetical protein
MKNVNVILFKFILREYYYRERKLEHNKKRG